MKLRPDYLIVAMERLKATYRILAPADEVRARTEAVLLEQTIETPVSVGNRYPFVREQMMGSVLELTEHPRGGFRAVLSLPVVTASIDPAQFLNVLFGNSSLHDNVELEDFELPARIASMLPGPRFGIAGMRARLGVTGRPLTCSALKPVGLTTEELAGLCAGLAAGGIDVIKDDHYLADHPFSPFEERVRACLDAVAEVYARTGHRTLYVPNLSGTPDQVFRQAEHAQQQGAEAVMIAPMLLGMPLLHELVRSRLEVPLLAHPSFAGNLRIRPATLLGRLFRLFGADAVIFANYGGRFAYPKEVCGEIAEALRAPWRDLAPAFPVPAGGMTVERAPELVEYFGLDTMLLIGGSLLEATDDLSDRTRAFVESVSRAAAAFGAAP